MPIDVIGSAGDVIGQAINGEVFSGNVHIGDVSGGSAYNFSGSWIGDLDVSDSGGSGEALLLILLVGFIFGSIMLLYYSAKFTVFIVTNKHSRTAQVVRRTLLTFTIAIAHLTSIIVFINSITPRDENGACHTAEQCGGLSCSVPFLFLAWLLTALYCVHLYKSSKLLEL